MTHGFRQVDDKLGMAGGVRAASRSSPMTGVSNCFKDSVVLPEIHEEGPWPKPALCRKTLLPKYEKNNDRYAHDGSIRQLHLDWLGVVCTFLAD